jgi:uncharacterized protein
VDIHAHLIDPRYVRAPTPERLQRYWMLNLPLAQNAEDMWASFAALLPGKQIELLAFGMPTLEADVPGQNANLLASAAQYPTIQPLFVARPEDTEETLSAALDAGFLGFKPYPDFVRSSTPGEERIADFLTPAMCRIADRRGALVMLHISRTQRFADADNIHDLLALAERWPGMRVIVAHLGRAYNAWYLEQGLDLLAQAGRAGNWYYDFSAVANRASLRVALARIPHERLCFGLDTPVAFARGYYTFPTDRSYRVHLHGYNLEAPDHLPVAYQILQAFRDAAQDVGLTRASIECICHRNADRLIGAAAASVRTPRSAAHERNRS